MQASGTLRRYRFGVFEAVPDHGELLRKGVRIHLQDQPFRLLAILLDRAGEVVSREELQQKLWSADTFVEFDGSLNSALKRLRAALADTAENPVFIETIPKRGYRFIAPVSVENQFVRTEAVEQSATDEAGPEPHPANVEPLPPVSARSLRYRLIYAIGLAIALAAAGLYLAHHRVSPPAAFSSKIDIPARKSVAVLGFKNLSGRAEDDWLATAFSEMLGTELSVGEKLRVVPEEEIANLRLAGASPLTSDLRRDTAVRIGSALNGDVLVLGSYSTVGSTQNGQLRLDVRLQDGRTGEVLLQVPQTCNRNELFQAAAELGAKLRTRLGVPEIRDTEQAQVIASLPLNREAARFYALGISKLREFDALGAKDLLVQAVAADPKFSFGHLMLSRAWSQLGYEQKRKNEVKAALALSTDLPRTDQLLVQGDYFESLAEHDRAASAYRVLYELFPDSVEYGLQLVGAEMLGGHETQALETIARLRLLPPPTSLDSRIDIAEARIPSRRSESLSLLQSAAAKATSQGKKLVYARSRLDECMQLTYGTHPEQAPLPCEDAYDIYVSAGNRLLAADAVRLMADGQGSQGHLNEAISSYRRALKILEGLGDHLKTATVLNNMAIVYTTQGNLDQAEALYRDAKHNFEQVGDKRNAGVALVNIADILYLRGNLPQAAKVYREVIDLELALENGDAGYAMYRLADLELARGNVSKAHSLAQQALDSLRAKNAGLDGAMSEMGEILTAEADFKDARQEEQSAMELRRAQGKTLEASQNLASLAEISLEEGHPAEAEAALHEALAEFEKERADPAAAAGYALLSCILLAQDKIQEVRPAIKDATQKAKANRDPALNLAIAIEEARIDSAGTNSTSLGSSRSALRAAIRTANNLGYYRLGCEARLAMGQLEMKTNPTLGHALLQGVAADASRKGLVLLARKASS